VIEDQKTYYYKAGTLPGMGVWHELPAAWVKLNQFVETQAERLAIDTTKIHDGYTCGQLLPEPEEYIWDGATWSVTDQPVDEVGDQYLVGAYYGPWLGSEYNGNATAELTLTQAGWTYSVSESTPVDQITIITSGGVNMVGKINGTNINDSQIMNAHVADNAQINPTKLAGIAGATVGNIVSVGSDGRPTDSGFAPGDLQTPYYTFVLNKSVSGSTSYSYPNITINSSNIGSLYPTTTIDFLITNMARVAIISRNTGLLYTAKYGQSGTSVTFAADSVVNSAPDFVLGNTAFTAPGDASFNGSDITNTFATFDTSGQITPAGMLVVDKLGSLAVTTKIVYSYPKNATNIPCYVFPSTFTSVTSSKILPGTQQIKEIYFSKDEATAKELSQQYEDTLFLFPSVDV
jgi:hypothetical protein